MAKMISEGAGAFGQHGPTGPVIITAQAKGKENAMTAIWHTRISGNPPLYGISVSPKRFTYQLILDSKEFGINFLPLEAAELVAAVGGSSGQEIDKFQRFNIAKDKPVQTKVPILATAYAAYECQLVDDREFGDHRFLVGEIVAVHRRQEAFTPEGRLDLDKVSPALYLGRELYFTLARDSVRHLERGVYGKQVY